MSDLGEGFNKVVNHNEPSEALLMPLMTWFSAYEKNIESIDVINTSFFYVDKSVLSRYLALHNQLKHFIKYPKSKATSELEFFDAAIIKKYNWSQNDLRANYASLDIDNLKRELSREFGFSKKEMELLGGNNGCKDKSGEITGKRGSNTRRTKSNS